MVSAQPFWIQCVAQYQVRQGTLWEIATEGDSFLLKKRPQTPSKINTFASFGQNVSLNINPAEPFLNGERLAVIGPSAPAEVVDCSDYVIWSSQRWSPNVHLFSALSRSSSLYLLPLSGLGFIRLHLGACGWRCNSAVAAGGC